MTAESNQSRLDGARYLSFSLGSEEYAIPLLEVREVIALPEIVSIPHAPAYFLGIMNLRGQVISVLDLRKKMQIKPREGSEVAVIICDVGSSQVGVVVDSVNCVLSPDPSHLSDAPDLQETTYRGCIQAVYRRDKNMILLMDIARALDLADRKIVENAQQATAKAA